MSTAAPSTTWRSRPRARRSAAQLRSTAPRSRTSRRSNTYVRKGEPGPLRDLERKALSVGSDPDGGYLVPDETEQGASTVRWPTSRPSAPSPAFARSRVRVYKQARSRSSGADTGWVGRDGLRAPQTAIRQRWLSSPFPTMELYAMPAATSSLLDDSVVNIDEWLAEAGALEPSRRRRAPPSSPATAPTSRRASSPTPPSPTRSGAWGNIGYIVTGRRRAASRHRARATS